MPSADTAAGELTSSLHRSILGVLLAVFAFLTLGWGWNTLQSGNVVLGLAGLALGAGAAYWILDLFVAGLRER